MLIYFSYYWGGRDDTSKSVTVTLLNLWREGNCPPCPCPPPFPLGTALNSTVVDVVTAIIITATIVATFTGHRTLSLSVIDIVSVTVIFIAIVTGYIIVTVTVAFITNTPY